MSSNPNSATASFGNPVLRLLPILCAFALVLVALPPSTALAQATPGSYAPAECPIAPIDGLNMDCGYLTVAESRATASDRTIQLAVATVRSTSPTPASDPVIFLAGGPGQGALPLIPVIAQFYAPILAERDIVFVDQRGTGYSQPSLTCIFPTDTMEGLIPFTTAEVSERPAIIQQLTDQLINCGHQYQQAGIDLSAYNSVENAADLEDLRVALGYSQWNLVGGSYGTRLALTAMQYRPETIRSAVLDSVYPLQKNFHVDVFSSFNQSLSRLFDDCASDPACNAAYPELGATYDQLIAQLNETPAQLPLTDPATGELITYYPLTGVDFSALLFQFFYVTEIIPILPVLISSTAAGDYDLAANLFSLLLLSNTSSSVPVISQGMQVATQCNEDATFATARDFVAARDANQRASSLAFSVLFNEAVLEVCDAWGLNSPNPAENAPVQSAVPSLLIGGAYDPITPAENMDLVAKDLETAYIIEVPRGGHTPSATSPCLGGAIASFISTLAEPDSSCVAQTAPLPFIVP